MANRWAQPESTDNRPLILVTCASSIYRLHIGNVGHKALLSDTP